MLRIIELGILVGLVGHGCQASAQASPAVASDRRSNGTLQLSVRQIMRSTEPDSRPVVWEGAIEISIKNISQLVVHVEESSLDYEFVLIDSSGHAVPRTDYGKQIEGVQRDPTTLAFSPPLAIYDLRPGETHTEVWGLRTFFEVQPGEDYTVRVRRLSSSTTLLGPSRTRTALRELSYTMKGKGRK